MLVLRGRKVMLVILEALVPREIEVHRELGDVKVLKEYKVYHGIVRKLLLSINLQWIERNRPDPRISQHLLVKYRNYLHFLNDFQVSEEQGRGLSDARHFR